jgi:hypothetical protein
VLIPLPCGVGEIPGSIPGGFRKVCWAVCLSIFAFAQVLLSVATEEENANLALQVVQLSGLLLAQPLLLRYLLALLRRPRLQDLDPCQQQLLHGLHLLVHLRPQPDLRRFQITLQTTKMTYSRPSRAWRLITDLMCRSFTRVPSTAQLRHTVCRSCLQ